MRVVLAVVVVGLCAGCGGGAPEAVTTAAAPQRPPAGAQTAATASLRWGACPQSLPGFRCGRLTVPLHRRGPHARDGRTLRLDVAVQRPRAGRSRGDLVLLSGGPGQPGLGFGPRMARRLGSAAAGHRIVVVDQRGTGRGALRCPSLQAAAGTSALAVPRRSAIAACARALGDRRDAFATADTVADLDALRGALGDAAWTLGGVSYGTFVAERYALAHPDRTRALVLDSVVPQEGAELLERVPLRATARVVRLIGGAAAVTDLRAVARHRPDLGPAVFDALTERSIGVPRLGGVPAVLRAAAAGDLAPLRRLLAATAPEERGVPAAFYSTGLHAATLCAD